MSPYKRKFMIALCSWLLISTTFVTVAVSHSRVVRAVVLMGWGLILIWIFLGGALMYRFRAPICRLVSRIRLPWMVTFVLFATLLAMAEEAVTTGLTNLAPLFGVRIGQAYITVSTNYIDVIVFHSVIMFIGPFTGWALLLRWRRFSPFAVFLLFGISGTLMETVYAGPQHLLEFGMWIPVYGLMVYLPAYCCGANRSDGYPEGIDYVAGIIFPILCVALIPVAAIPGLLFGKHPSMHFPPIRP